MDATEPQATSASESNASEADRDVAVQIANVTKEYGDVTAVDDVSLNVRDEEFLTLLGPSGAGKTTLLHMIAGFVTPTRGTINIDDVDVTHKPPYERNIGMVFQSMALFPHMTVGENIAFPLKMRRFDHDRIDERVQEMLDLIRLPEIRDRNVAELSGGQQQRVAIARGLAFKPSLLLLDEPLSSLDKKLREEMREELLRIHREAEVTTVHVTHNQEEALTMADRIAVIKEGEIAQHSSVQKMYSRPNSAFVADFVGNTNMLPGHVATVNEQRFSVDFGDDIVSTCQPSVVDTDPVADDQVTVGVRYEQVQIDERLDTDNAYNATVSDVIFMGDVINYKAEIDSLGVEVNISELNSKDVDVFERGDAVQVGWEDDDTLVYSS
ncbi:ABC transporter ATP-binding protein [Natrarchaeobius halalkaliphilus]|uniref:Molybdate/tungstate import ATP-binding protein WtpC n=2 Tax=Natrarchaeobius halalkaliphilus TaxID=1679091 RepID=A0A3N6MTE0_9EURY|nr:ABC transporter ATP-binding protein [Natrarchaeobius halalkaliphilus]